MSHMSSPPLDLEREYTRWRRPLLEWLRREFPTLRDREELYQEAWTEALALQERGEEIRNPEALIRTILWRRARDRIRNFAPAAVEPDALADLALVDPAPTPEETAATRIDGAIVRHVIDTMEARQAAVLKLRFDYGMSYAEIEQRLGISKRRVEKLINRALRHIESTLTAANGDESAWTRHQRSLLCAWAAGMASTRQLAELRRMVRDDPSCRALLLQMRATTREIAALLPPPVLIEEDHVNRLSAMWTHVQDAVLPSRGHAEVLTARLAPTAEQATSIGLGRVAGDVLRAALVCVTAAGGALVCVQTGVFPGTGPKKDPPRAEQPRHQPAPRVPREPQQRPPPTTTTSRAPRTTRRASRPKPNAATSSPDYRTKPSPAPAGSEEFGPGAIGSTERPTQPAAAPTDGAGEFLP